MDEQFNGPFGPVVVKLAVSLWTICRCLGLKVSKRILGGLLSLVNFNYFREFNTLGYIGVYILCLGVCVLSSVAWFLSCFSVNLINYYYYKLLLPPLLTTYH